MTQIHLPPGVSRDLAAEQWRPVPLTEALRNWMRTRFAPKKKPVVVKRPWAAPGRRNLLAAIQSTAKPRRAYG